MKLSNKGSALTLVKNIRMKVNVEGLLAHTTQILFITNYMVSRRKKLRGELTVK